MPPTNDVNEGALGAYRLYIWRKPTTTNAQYNALAMFNFNNTAAFMAKYFTKEDYAHTRAVVRAAESDHTEQKLRAELRAAQAAKAEARTKFEKEKATRIATAAAALAKVKRANSTGDIVNWLVKDLEDQLALYRALKVALSLDGLQIPLKSHLRNKAQKFDAFVAAFEWLEANGYGVSSIQNIFQGGIAAGEDAEEATGGDEEHFGSDLE